MKTKKFKTFLNNLFPWAMVLVGAMFYSFGSTIFINSAKIFATGLMAVSNLIVYLSPDSANLSQYLTLIYLGLNIPLIVIFWRKISKKFIRKTTFFLISAAAFGVLFSLIKEESIHNLINRSANENNLLTDYRWDYRWSIFILSIVGGIINAIGFSISWRFGGSSGGADIFTYYYSFKHKKSIAKINSVISSGILIVSVVICLATNKPNNIQEHWMVTFLGSVFFLFSFLMLAAFIYPKYSKVQINIFSEEYEKISSYFKSNNFHHSWSISHLTSGYTGKEKISISTIILVLELKDIVHEIKKIDPNAWISIFELKEVFGNFNTSGAERYN